MKMKEVFNKTKTTNGDDAFRSSGNKYLDIVFGVLEGRRSKKPLFNGLLKRGNPKDILFSMFVRDPRYGMGERKVATGIVGAAEIFSIFVEIKSEIIHK